MKIITNHFNAINFLIVTIILAGLKMTGYLICPWSWVFVPLYVFAGFIGSLLFAWIVVWIVTKMA